MNIFFLDVLPSFLQKIAFNTHYTFARVARVVKYALCIQNKYKQILRLELKFVFRLKAYFDIVDYKFRFSEIHLVWTIMGFFFFELKKHYRKYVIHTIILIFFWEKLIVECASIWLAVKASLHCFFIRLTIDTYGFLNQFSFVDFYFLFKSIT